MINKITRETELSMDFNIFLEDTIENSYEEHHKGDSFYLQSIVEINEEYFPELDRSFDGFWETNMYLHSENYGHENSDITELNRVEKKEQIVKTTYWEVVK